MLTQLKLSNFRIFDDEVTVRFRPITVLIGRNSSGKSSIIKFLLMLQQSMDPARSQFLTAEGDKVNLGVFSELKNSLTRKRSLTFDVTAKQNTGQIDQSLSMYLGLPADSDNSKFVYRGSAAVSYSKKTTTGRATYSLEDEASGKGILTVVSALLDDTTFGHYAFPNEAFELGSEQNGTEESDERRGELLEQRRAMLIRSLAELETTGTLRYQIHSLRHLLPVRTESQRVIVASPPPVDNVGQTGQYSLPHLQRLVSENRELYEFILPHLRHVVGIDSVEFKTSSGYLTQAFAKNRATGADVLIADYGFGVGQCLPILVQGTIMAPETTLMVEQPEAQLHPTAQLELGSFFADLWNRRQVGSIIETHSDNILLRLRRLIARGELSPEDVSVAFFTTDEDNRNMPIVKNLDINEDGTMQPGLPMEFFGRNIIEGIRLGVRE